MRIDCVDDMLDYCVRVCGAVVMAIIDGAVVMVEWERCAGDRSMLMMVCATVKAGEKGEKDIMVC